jgi:hypothetical protein
MRRLSSGGFGLRSFLAGLVMVAAWVGTSQVQGQVVQRQVAGVWIDADNILRNLDRDDSLKQVKDLIAQADEVPGDMQKFSELRKVSLRRLEQTIAECKVNNRPLPDDVRYLAGLQRIKYVFVYPEEHDIVLVGPAEGWMFNQQGEVVGKTTGKPVMMLDDLLVGLRTAERARNEGISCSIDPTAEGLDALQSVAKSLRQGPGVLELIEKTLGMQNISVTGIPADSHFARVIVAADYKMKRLAMNLDRAPIAGMPSYMDLIGAGPRGMNNMMPRWWLAPNYDSLLTDGDGTAYEFRTAGVKCVAEEDFLTAAGARERQKKASGPIKKWADTMTAKYDQLAAKDVVFGQLRNCIDLAVVAALITKEDLTARAGYRFGILMDGEQLPADRYHAPKQVPSKASVMQKRGSWVISASGGVQIESWALADKAETSESLTPVRKQALASTQNWWWD